MSIVRVEIENYKSIKRCALDLNDINLLIGENGTGKTNILDALRYFYDSLLKENGDEGEHNYRNRFSNEFEITVTFDFGHLKKISANNKTRDADSGYHGYYAWICRRERYESLRLRKIKGKAARWNQDRKYRQNISNLFPLYFVDAREVNLTDWRQLWDIIGDLMKVHRSREAEIAGEIDAIKNSSAYKLEERFTKLSDSFSKANIQVRPFTPKQYASAISALLFKGDVFEFRKGRLDYMSNGTNAFNYTNLLMEILKLISEFKIKDPIMILDEPEISLHHKLIDQMTDRMFSCNGAIRLLIASHSSRMLKNVIRSEQSECRVFHVSSHGGYTNATPVVLFSQEADGRPRVVMTDQHANAYFSRYILSVEGASEMEVFSNAYLQQLFPFMRDVDVMEGMSNDIVQRIISPRQRHLRTRFLLLMDMDKAVRRKENNTFALENRYFSEGAEAPENYYYSSRRTEQFLRKKRIRAMAEKSRFHYWYPFFSCQDVNFEEFLSLIKEFLLDKGIYTARTTVEGMLINKSNLNSFWDYYTERNGHGREFAGIYARYLSFLKNDSLNFMRLLYSGKSDHILNLDEIKRANPKIDRELCGLIERNRVDKTSGWITDWLNYSICRSVFLKPDDENAFGRFCKMLEDTQTKYTARKEFQMDFPELYEVLQIIREQMKVR